MKTIIAGSRTITDYSTVLEAIAYANFGISEIVCGECRGPDLLGRKFAEEIGLPVKNFPANWNAFGKNAGPKRNREMAEYADALIAIWDGCSNGTANMINEAKVKGLKVSIYLAQPTPVIPKQYSEGL